MKFNVNQIGKYVIPSVIGLVIGSILTTYIVINFTITQQMLSIQNEFHRICGGVISKDTYIDADGSPSECYKEGIAKISGYSPAVLATSSWWVIAKNTYGSDKEIDDQWKALAAISTKGFEELEWPVVAFHNIPVFQNVYSPPGLLECVEKMKTGINCQL